MQFEVPPAGGGFRKQSSRLKAKPKLFFPLPCPATKKDIDCGTASRVYNHCVTDQASAKSFLRSGELARLAGVSADTLRHYERRGLLAPRRSRNGYREYSLPMLERVRVIRRAIACGFTIDELAKIFRAKDQGGAPCRQVRQLAQTKLTDVERQLRELEAVRDNLSSMLADWDERLARTDEHQRAGLLDSLANQETVNVKNNSPIKRPSLKYPNQECKS
ncbi:MAG: heavy metal-responsive transcriptional regulator [Acidobacteria bacterium]|nr:heavy metal-responsive transcriptional regulator [Acidobacteriota bacterium]